MTFALQDQNWLIDAPANFSELNQKLRDGCENLTEQIFELANTRLDLKQLTALSNHTQPQRNDIIYRPLLNSTSVLQVNRQQAFLQTHFQLRLHATA